jgi:hypothetical protein
MDATYGPDELHALTVTAALRTRPQRTASDLSRVVDGKDIQRSLDLWHRLGHVRWQMKDLGPCVGSARAMTTAPSYRRFHEAFRAGRPRAPGRPANLQYPSAESVGVVTRG